MTTREMESPKITPLARPVSTRLRSALVIPTLPQILNELVQNSLDAQCSKVECWVDLSRGNESIKVVDDGHGLDAEALKRVGERYVTSKERIGELHTPLTGYGFRGEALSSVSALGSLEITTKTAASRHTHTKVLRSGETLVRGKSNRSIPGNQGTSVAVKEIFQKIPVRQASLASTSNSTILSGCKRIIEALALVHPSIKWSLWEERCEGPSMMNEPRRVLSINAGKNSLETYRAIFGKALVERVQNIRVSSGNKRIDGFISLQGSVSRSNQHIYVNKFPIDRGEIHNAISKRFASSRFSFMTQDDVEDSRQEQGRRQSPRRLERHPIYVLNLTMPPEEVDAVFDPKKRVLGFGDQASVQSFVLAVVDEYLKRNGFASSKTHLQMMPASSPTRSRRRSGDKPTQPSITPLSQRFAQVVPSVHQSMPLPSQMPRKRTLHDNAPPPSTPVSEHDRHRDKRMRSNLVDDILAKSDTGFLPVIPSLISAFTTPTFPTSTSARRRCSHRSTTPHTSMTDINFTTDGLETAQVIGQIDNKFIACLLSTKSGEGRSLVLIDQHAADERVAVEEILRELCDGFQSHSVKRTEVKDTQIILTSHEAAQLSNPDVQDIFARWGIDFDPPPVPPVGDYVQIGVRAVPSILAYRLARKEASELTKLVRQYLANLPTVNEVEAYLSSHRGNGAKWQTVQRWMPKEMLDLANSKACRNAIMFEDPLNLDQCQRLVHRLSNTDSPWICAHGRPSLVPLGMVPNQSSGAERIGWAAWGR